MKLGGNKRARDYLDLKPATLLDRYSGERAQAYREMLRKEVLTQLGYVINSIMHIYNIFVCLKSIWVFSCNIRKFGIGFRNGMVQSK